jgi:plastocyanin
MQSQNSSHVNRATVLAAVPLAVLAIVGCGGDNGSSEKGNGAATRPSASGKAPKSATTLRLRADPGGALRFDKKSLEAPAGAVTIEMKDQASVQHNVAIEGNGVDEVGPSVSDGGTSTVKAELEPGKYEFYCSVDGHEGAGMKGTLTVR